MLTDKAIRALRPTAKPRKVADSLGMYLLLPPNGSRLWRFKYRFDGKENVTAIGAYPEIGLADARERRDELRRLLSSGIDPAARRKATRVARSTAAENSLEVIAREWFQRMSPRWVEKHRVKIIQRLERDVFPWVGNRPVAELTAPEILAVLHRIEGRDAVETAHRALGNLSAVCRYAVATGRALSDPCRDIRGGACAESCPAFRCSHRTEGDSRPPAGDCRLPRWVGGALRAAPCTATVRPPGRTALGAVGRHRP